MSYRPTKIADPFYFSPLWKALRKATFERDGYRCVTPGCGRPAKVCDHIVSRRKGGDDALKNLRSLCVSCDNKIKEDKNGKRRNKGILRGRIGADGWPVE